MAPEYLGAPGAAVQDPAAAAAAAAAQAPAAPDAAVIAEFEAKQADLTQREANLTQDMAAFRNISPLIQDPRVRAAMQHVQDGENFQVTPGSTPAQPAGPVLNPMDEYQRKLEAGGIPPEYARTLREVNQEIFGRMVEGFRKESQGISTDFQQKLGAVDSRFGSLEHNAGLDEFLTSGQKVVDGLDSGALAPHRADLLAYAKENGLTPKTGDQWNFVAQAYSAGKMAKNGVNDILARQEKVQAMGAPMPPTSAGMSRLREQPRAKRDPKIPFSLDIAFDHAAKQMDMGGIDALNQVLSRT